MKFLHIILIVLFLCSHIPVVQADTVEDEFKLQLVAIIEYLERQLPLSTTPLDHQEIREVIYDGALWTIHSQEESGHFRYEYLPFEGEYAEDDNMIRQGGTLFALSEVYRKQTKKDPKVAAAIEKAITYFESVSTDNDVYGEFSCIKNSRSGTRCDLGSTALALLGILNYIEAEPKKVSEYEKLIEQYASYITEAKFADRGFSNRYFVTSGFSKEESPFYNGEAMLALVRYYQYHENEEVKQILQDSFAYLSAKEEYETPLYLWIMAALKDMHVLWPNEAYVEYAQDFTSWRLNQVQYKHNTTHNYCAPIEGLVSAYSILEETESVDFMNRLEQEINFWLHKTTSLQLSKERPYRVVAQDGGLLLTKLSQPDIAHGGFLTGETELTQRIDFTQHCLSTYLQKLVDIDGESL